MNNDLLKGGFATNSASLLNKKVLTRTGMIAGFCLASLVASYASPAESSAKAKDVYENPAIQQTRKVKGTVTDANGEPVIGANVVVKGTTNGTITDVNGEYTLDVPNNATLVVSYIGYSPKEIKVGTQSKVNVALAEEAIGLDEVVAIGYGYVKKKT